MLEERAYYTRRGFEPREIERTRKETREEIERHWERVIAGLRRRRLEEAARRAGGILGRAILASGEVHERLTPQLVLMVMRNQSNSLK